VSGVGVIETPGAWDDYTFTGTAGQWVYVDSAVADPFGTPFQFTLSTSDGTTLISRFAFIGPIRLIQLPNTGTYSLRVASTGGETGNYQLAVHEVPVGVDDAFTFNRGSRIRISIPELWANDTGLGNAGPANPSNFWLPSPLTSGGGRLRQAGAWLIYEPPAGVVEDSFQYSIGYPGLQGPAAAMSLVTVRIRIAQGEAGSLNVSSVAIEPGSGVRVRFAGIPGRTYRVQRSLQLSPATWVTLGEATADPQGRMEYLDAELMASSAFYRTVEP